MNTIRRLDELEQKTGVKNVEPVTVCLFEEDALTGEKILVGEYIIQQPGLDWTALVDKKKRLRWLYD